MKRNLLSTSLIVIALTACGGGGGGGGGDYSTGSYGGYTGGTYGGGSTSGSSSSGSYSGGGSTTGIYIDPLVTTNGFVDKLNDVDPQFYLHEIVKDPATDIDYFVFWDETISDYVAMDIWGLQNESWGVEEAVDAYLGGELVSYYEFVDPDSPAAVNAYYNSGMTEVFYEGIDTGYLYEDTEGSEKDMLYAAKIIEEVALKKQGESIADSYGLSEDQGIRLATVIQNWKSLSETREMTEADADAFSEEMFGFNFNDLETAISKIQAGDESDADALIEQASEAIDTTPENVRRIMFDLL